MNLDRITDLHCHPSFKPFNKGNFDGETYTIWQDIPPDTGSLEEIHPRIQDFLLTMERGSQCNFDRLVAGKVRGIFCTIHPFERGWVKIRNTSLARRADRWFDLKADLKYIAAALSGMHLEKVSNIFSQEISNGSPTDYYKHTFAEYDFLRRSEQDTGSAGGRFQIARNYTHYQEILAENQHNVAGILNIEGLHALSHYPYWDIYHRLWTDLSPVEQNSFQLSIHNNIQKIKGLPGPSTTNDVFRQEHTPFYVTPAHFYNCFMVGHARSYDRKLSKIFDQKFGLKKELSGFGREVIEQLLHRDENQRRILIDVKHMSWNSRQDYYDLVDFKRAHEDDPIPIIYSHGAINGMPYSRNNERKEFTKHQQGFYSGMSINLYDEDIQRIIGSGGIIGISPHEGRMPGTKALKQLRKLRRDAAMPASQAQAEAKKIYMQLFMGNILHIVRVIGSAHAWNHITLGTDFDGIMDPFDRYPKSDKFEALLHDVLEFLHNPQPLDNFPGGRSMSVGEIHQLKFGIPPEDIIRKIAYVNLEEFLQDYFTDEYLGPLPAAGSV